MSCPRATPRLKVPGVSNSFTVVASCSTGRQCWWAPATWQPGRPCHLWGLLLWFAFWKVPKCPSSVWVTLVPSSDPRLSGWGTPSQIRAHTSCLVPIPHPPGNLLIRKVYSRVIPQVHICVWTLEPIDGTLSGKLSFYRHGR